MFGLALCVRGSIVVAIQAALLHGHLDTVFSVHVLGWVAVSVIHRHS